MKIKIKDANTHINKMSGYGQLSSALASGLASLGHDIYYDYITGCDDPLLDKLAKKEFEHTPDTIYLWVRPPHYAKNDDYIKEHTNVFFTMHESPTLEGWKSDWATLLNTCKAVITPTTWNKGVFQTNGVVVPIHVVPLGVNTKAYKPYIEDTFNVLSVHEGIGSNSSREDWKMTASAYFRILGDRNAKWTIKSWKTKLTQWDTFRKDKIGAVYIAEGSLQSTDLADVYRRQNVFVKNSNREGWSLPLTEAMACGLPVIVRENSVLRENVREYPRVYWFKREEQLAYYLDSLYKQWIKEKSMLDMFSWKHTVKLTEGILEKL